MKSLLATQKGKVLLQLRDSNCLSIFEDCTNCTIHSLNYTLLRLTYTTMFFKQCHLSLLTQPTTMLSRVVLLFLLTFVQKLTGALSLQWQQNLSQMKVLQRVSSYLTDTSLIHGIICITKHQHLFCFPTNFPFLCGISLFSFLCLGDDIFVSLPQGTYTIRLTIYVHLFLHNLTHIISKSTCKERCRLEHF